MGGRGQPVAPLFCARLRHDEDNWFGFEISGRNAATGIEWASETARGGPSSCECIIGERFLSARHPQSLLLGGGINEETIHYSLFRRPIVHCYFARVAFSRTSCRQGNVVFSSQWEIV